MISEILSTFSYLKYSYDFAAICHEDTKFPVVSDSHVLGSGAVIHQDSMVRLKCPVRTFWHLGAKGAYLDSNIAIILCRVVLSDLLVPDSLKYRRNLLIWQWANHTMTEFRFPKFHAVGAVLHYAECLMGTEAKLLRQYCHCVFCNSNRECTDNQLRQ